MDATLILIHSDAAMEFERSHRRRSRRMIDAQDLDRCSLEPIGHDVGFLGMTSSRVPGTRPARSIRGLSGSNCSMLSMMSRTVRWAVAGLSSAI
jgi:hypothetical protein